VESNQVNPYQILTVLELLHTRASYMYDDDGCNLTYEEALAKVFDDLWTTTQQRNTNPF
jgi:hypothetical protein